MKTIPAADIGGTKARLALFEACGQEVEITAARSFPVRDYPDLETILGGFLSEPACIRMLRAWVSPTAYAGA